MTDTKMKKTKIEWVVTLKVIGITAVILGHIASPLGAFIFSWHMPLFFFMAGFFLKTNLEPYQFMVKEFQRLMIPYFIFALLALLIETIKRMLLNREQLDSVVAMKGVFFWMDMEALINSYAFVLWFLPALFVARFCTYVIIKYVGSSIIQLFVVAGLFLTSFHFQLPFAMDNGLNALIFVYLGGFLYKAEYDIWPFALLLIGIYFFYGFPTLDMSQKQYANILLNIIWAGACSYILIKLSKQFNKTPSLVVLWGSNTMLLFILHPYTNNVASVFVDKLGYGEWYLKLALSLTMLQCVLLVKNKFHTWMIFKYV